MSCFVRTDASNFFVSHILIRRASSILQRNTTQYGPLNALDTHNRSSCWNSEGTAESNNGCWFLVDFGRPVKPDELKIQFQAGFCAETCSIYCKHTNNDEWILIDDTVEFDDVHELQTLPLNSTDSTTTRAIKLQFDDTTDFYGRVTIYRLEVWGRECGNETS